MKQILSIAGVFLFSHIGLAEANIALGNESMTGYEFYQQQASICKRCVPMVAENDPSLTDESEYELDETPPWDELWLCETRWHNISGCAETNGTGIIFPGLTEVSCNETYAAYCYCEETCEAPPTTAPTKSPSKTPTLSPTKTTTKSPTTVAASASPSKAPTKIPSKSPTYSDIYEQFGDKIVPSMAGATEQYGRALALSGDGQTAFIGSRAGYSIAVYNYSDVDGWVEVDPITISGATFAKFGVSVAVNKVGAAAHLLVGAPGDDFGGSVRYFTQDEADGSWVPADNPDIYIDGISEDAEFGSIIDVDGTANTAVFGVPLCNSPANGCVIVYSRTGAVWSHNATFNLTTEDTENNFGKAVAISSDGSIIAAGTSHYNGGQGAVWIYKYEPVDSEWVMISPFHGLTGSHRGFGHSLCFLNETETLVIAATDTFDDAEFPNAVYTYEFMGEDQSEEYEGNQLYGNVDVFEANGIYVAGYGDVLIQGSTFYDADETITNDTSVVYKRTPEKTWQPVQELQGTGGVPPSIQGFVIATNGEFVLIGGPLDDGTIGAIWFFRRIGAE